MMPLDRIMQFWAARAGSTRPKTEQEAIILHNRVKEEKGCWDCPTRLQCEWAERMLKLHAENRKLIRLKMLPKKTEVLLPSPQN